LNQVEITIDQITRWRMQKKADWVLVSDDNEEMKVGIGGIIGVEPTGMI